MVQNTPPRFCPYDVLPAPSVFQFTDMIHNISAIFWCRFGFKNIFTVVAL
eukprot:UN21042